MRSPFRHVGWRSIAARSLVAALAVGALGGCSSEPKDPVELREERVRTRIEDSFSRSQATCIMKVLDEPTMVALDRKADLPANSEAMRIYSNAVVACAGAG